MQDEKSPCDGEGRRRRKSERDEIDSVCRLFWKAVSHGNDADLANLPPRLREIDTAARKKEKRVSIGAMRFDLRYARATGLSEKSKK
jgi:hypothetical protein